MELQNTWCILVRKEFFLIFALFINVFSVYGSSPIPIGPTKVEPHLKWSQFETDHFLVYYPSGSEEIAQSVAFLAEKTHRTLIRKMGKNISQKTHVVINDSIDIVNGVATPLGYNQIFLYPSQPVLGMGHFDNWLEMLLIHEYTHILDMSEMSGFQRSIQKIFGRIWFPKAFTSNFFLEGYAIYNESAKVNQGRIYDAYVQMQLRQAFLDKKVPSLNDLLFWEIYPGGNEPYLYGSSFYDFLGTEYGDKKPHMFQKNISGPIWPWRYNLASLVTAGNTLFGLYIKWLEKSMLY